MTPTRALAGAGLVVAAACASAPPLDETAMRVTGTNGVELWRGPATFTVRGTGGGRAERVVALPGLGEVQVALDGSRCRLVWSKDGLDRLALLDGDRCGERAQSGRMCFRAVEFAAATKSPHGSAPSRVVVDGCADENDLLWSKLDGHQLASVGPTPWRQRCARLPRKRGCELVYVKRDSVRVASNPAGKDGFTLVYDGDGWRACFLEKASGRYQVRLTVEDSCGSTGQVTLAGDSADLDD